MILVSMTVHDQGDETRVGDTGCAWKKKGAQRFAVP